MQVFKSQEEWEQGVEEFSEKMGHLTPMKLFELMFVYNQYIMFLDKSFIDGERVYPLNLFDFYEQVYPEIVKEDTNGTE